MDAAPTTLRRPLRLPAAAALVLVALALSTGTWYAATTAASVTPIEAGAARGVHTLAPGSRLPAGVRSLRYTDAVSADGRLESLRAPSWTPAPGAVGSVARAGDIALVDARGVEGTAVVNVHLTNLAELRRAYASFALPIAVWAAADPSSPESWTRVDGAGPPYLTSLDGVVSFTVPGGRLYDLTLETGGMWSALPAARGDWSPEFYVQLTN